MHAESVGSKRASFEYAVKSVQVCGVLCQPWIYLWHLSCCSDTCCRSRKTLKSDQAPSYNFQIHFCNLMIQSECLVGGACCKDIISWNWDCRIAYEIYSEPWVINILSIFAWSLTKDARGGGGVRLIPKNGNQPKEIARLDNVTVKVIYIYILYTYIHDGARLANILAVATFNMIIWIIWFLQIGNSWRKRLWGRLILKRISLFELRNFVEFSRSLLRQAVH